MSFGSLLIICPSSTLSRPVRFVPFSTKEPLSDAENNFLRLPAVFWGSALLLPCSLQTLSEQPLALAGTMKLCVHGGRAAAHGGCLLASVWPRGQLHILLRALVSQPVEGRSHHTQQEERFIRSCRLLRVTFLSVHAELWLSAVTSE